MQTQIRRALITAGLLLTLGGATLAATPASAQASPLAQYSCEGGFCGVVPAAWESPYAYNSFADAVNLTNYANVANYVGYRNVVNAVNYTNLANYVAYRNAVNTVEWAAGQ